MLMSACVATPIFLSDSNSKDLLFPRGPNLTQKPLYLVGTVLKVNLISVEVIVRMRMQLEIYATSDVWKNFQMTRVLYWNS